MGEESMQVDVEMGKGIPSCTVAETPSLPSSMACGHGDPRVAPLAYEVKKKLSELSITRYPMHSIFRVPPDLRMAAGEDYEPKLVSIGPLHRGKERLLPMEKVKLVYLQDLLNRDKRNSVENYFQEIFEFLEDVKSQYSEKIDLSDEEFVEMLVVDGSFIIEYWMKRIFDGTENTPLLAGGRWGFFHMRRDLLLLENQIPFVVLSRLFEKTEIPFSEKRLKPLELIEFALKYLEIDTPSKPREVHHLLHLEHHILDPDEFEEPNRRFYDRMAWLPLKKLTDLSSMVFFGVLYLIFFFHLPPLSSGTKKSNFPARIPCATQLVEAGMVLKRKETPRAQKHCQLKLSFRDGSLEIPFLAVDEATGPRLRNLIALEQSRKDIENYVTSYCVFMDNIINTAGDVAVLQSRGILESKLDSDEEVAKVFNGLCKGTHLDYDTHCNAELFRSVVGFCDFYHHKWRAILFRSYFNKWRAGFVSIRWAWVSVLASLLLLFFTATQTYCAAFPR